MTADRVCISTSRSPDVRELVRERRLRARPAWPTPSSPRLDRDAPSRRRPATRRERARVAVARARTASGLATRASAARRSTVGVESGRLAARQLAGADHPERDPVDVEVTAPASEQHAQKRKIESSR